MQTPRVPAEEAPPDTPQAEDPAREADDLLCAEFEARQRLEDDAEGPSGCDWPEGALSAAGCHW